MGWHLTRRGAGPGDQGLTRSKFWELTNAGYAALRADSVAWAEVEAETRLLGV